MIQCCAKDNTKKAIEADEVDKDEKDSQLNVKALLLRVIKDTEVEGIEY